MTWGDFNSAVRVHLTTHSRRQGIQTFIDTLIKAAVADLQSGIPSLRCGHTSTYVPERFVTDGFAGRARVPVGAVITAAYAQDPDDETRKFDFEFEATERGERDMIDGRYPMGSRRISIRPARGQFWVTPNPAVDGSKVVLKWDGSKTDFASDDETPFDDTVALVAADFVLARLARRVDNDIEGARSYDGTYREGKRRIKSDANEAASIPGRTRRV